jgi:hypothetical protein
LNSLQRIVEEIDGLGQFTKMLRDWGVTDPKKALRC